MLLRPIRLQWVRASFFALVIGVCAECGAAEPEGPWTRYGDPVSGDEISSSAGPGHCGWEDAHFLAVSWAGGRQPETRTMRQYIRDPDGVLGQPDLQTRYRPSVPLPDGAVDTGYENDGYRLWFADKSGDGFAYLTRDGGRTAEAWPLDEDPIGCD